MVMKKISYVADHDDVYRHLASEELMLESLDMDATVLYLWHAADAMVIGKNQNPWLECNLPVMADAQCRLARRISGGGAVFHDVGNLNYSVFMSKAAYDRDMISSMILNALTDLGIPGNVGERHLLEVNGKKFSGNAFCIRREKVLHHGTLLVNADLKKLVAYAEPTCSGIEAKGIRSVPSTVGNLSEHDSDLTIERLKEQLFKVFSPDVAPVPFVHADCESRTAQFAADEWLYHRTPRFIARGADVWNGFSASIEAEVVRGHVKTVKTVPENITFSNRFKGVDFRTFLKNTPALVVE